MIYSDLPRRTAAVLDTATGGIFFNVLGTAIDDGHDLDVQVVMRPPSYVVLLHVLDGQRVVEAREVVVEHERLEDRVRLVLLQLHVGQVLLGAARWRHAFDRQLAALGIGGPTTATPV